LAYSFLEDLSQEFYAQFGHKINTATRPYSFIEFGRFSFLFFSFLLLLFTVSRLISKNFHKIIWNDSNKRAPIKI
jgi:hypothetical protein